MTPGTISLLRAAPRRMARAALIMSVLIVAACANVPGATPGAQGPQPAPSVDRGPTTKVALLLPLSGQAAQIGQPMLDAAQMALFDVADERFELMPRDTGGSPNGAAEAARRAVAEGAQLILGPLFAPEVAAVKTVAQPAGVNVIAFSTDASLADPSTHIIGFVPGQQVDRVVGFARARGMTRFAVVAPRSPYGDAAVAAVQNAALRAGVQVVRAERYDPNLTDFSLPAGELARAPTPPQAVLLAEGGERVKTLAGALAAAGVNPQQVRFLGTGLWDAPGLGQQPALVGAWFAAPTPNNRADFERRFQELHGAPPPRIATLAYDATALAAALSRLGGPQPLDRRHLTQPSGFEGIDGLFRLTGAGVAERGLAVLEVTPEGARVIDPAPTTFQALGQ